MAPGEFTILLQRWSEGDEAALDTLTPIVYEELRRLARFHFARERGEQTLQPTELVSEAYLKLAGQKQNQWQGRTHFYGIASRVMRQILIERARSRGAIKRGAGERPVSFDEAVRSAETRGDLVLALDDALLELAKIDERKSRLIEMKYFGGLTGEELTEAFGISLSTVGRECRLAEAWLHRYLMAQ